MIIFILTENCAAISGARILPFKTGGRRFAAQGAAGPAGTDGPEQAQSACQSAAPLYKQINS